MAVTKKKNENYTLEFSESGLNFFFNAHIVHMFTVHSTDF